MRRLILHIGPHKTGTSSFQHWLRDNAAALAAAGLAVPVELLNANANGAPLAHAFLAAPQDRSPEQTHLIAAFAQFCQAHPTANVIVSAERFCQPLFSDRIDADGRNIREKDAQRRREARQLYDAVSTLGFDRIDLLVLIRDQVGFLTSAYMQQLKTLNARWDFSTRPLNDLPVRRYSDSFRHLTEVGFHVVAAPYRDTADNRPLPARLMDMAGYGRAAMGGLTFDTPPQNISPGFLTMIGLGHVFWMLENRAAATNGNDLTALRRGIAQVTRLMHVADDSPMTLFAPDKAAQIARRQRAYLDGIENWTGRRRGADIAGTFPAHGPQSPLSRSELNADQRARVDAWLQQVSRGIKGADRISGMIDHAQLTDLDASPAGVHAAPLRPAPCLGGIWAALPPDGRRPASPHRAEDRAL